MDPSTIEPSADNPPNYTIIKNEEAIEYERRRKFQNRIAQRRFRERAKKQKQPASKPSQGSKNSLIHPKSHHQRHHCDLRSSYSGFPSIGRLPADNEIARAAAESWSKIGVSSDSYDLTSHGILQQQPLEPDSSLQGMFSQNQYPTPTDMSEIYHPGPPFPNSSAYPSIQGIKAPMIDEIPYQGLAMNNLSLRQGGTGSTTPERDSQSRLGFHVRDTENIAEKEKALAILQKQRIHLGSQIEQLIHESMSLYDLGVALEIFPFDPDFRQLLLTAHGRFRSLWQSAEGGCNKHETGIERTGSETDGVDSLDYAAESRNKQVNVD